jgi:hypothetical protein
MKKALSLAMLLLCWMIFLTTSADAAVEWQTLKTLELNEKLVDVAITPDGRWTFALTAGGDVLVYSAAGKLEDTLNVGGKFDGISSSAQGDKIFLTNRTAGTVQIIAVEFVKEIDTSTAPIQGPPDAPVTIAVFDDFQ